MKALWVQAGAELRLTLRRGESLLLTLGIPVGLLVFLALTKVLPSPSGQARFLVPGILALAIMSTGLVSVGIATAFEREYQVLKRLGVTPLGRPRLVLAKVLSVVAVEVMQAAVIVGAGLTVGWRPGASVRHGSTTGPSSSRSGAPRWGHWSRGGWPGGSHGNGAEDSADLPTATRATWAPPA